MYSIRAAHPQDYSALPAIEQAAGMMYLRTRYRDLAFGPNVSGHLDPDDRVWVAVRDEVVVAFAIVKIFAEFAHIHELDVHPAQARRGLGRALITHIVHWARNRGLDALTLTTFMDVPWNAPYYKRLGFAVIEMSALPPHLKAILESEARAGLDMTHRVGMRMLL